MSSTSLRMNRVSRTGAVYVGMLTSVSANLCLGKRSPSSTCKCKPVHIRSQPKGKSMKPGNLLAAAALIAVPASAAPRTETAVLAGGCFWGMESVFEHVKGVTNVVSGYAGGSAADANYEASGSGHAEAVRITFDPAQISYSQLLQ